MRVGGDPVDEELVEVGGGEDADVHVAVHEDVLGESVRAIVTVALKGPHVLRRAEGYGVVVEAPDPAIGRLPVLGTGIPQVDVAMDYDELLTVGGSVHGESPPGHVAFSSGGVRAARRARHRVPFVSSESRTSVTHRRWARICARSIGRPSACTTSGVPAEVGHPSSFIRAR